LRVFKRTSTWAMPAAIAAVTLLFRFYRLASVPIGLTYDEAFEGLDGYSLLSKPLHRWPLFFTGNYGREPLFVYLTAAVQALVGPGALSLHLLTAIIGTLLTPAMAWLAWEMAPSLGLNRRRLTLWAAATPLLLLAIQILSRYATRNLLLAPVEAFMFAALWRAWRTGGRVWWAVSGVLAGLSFYTYIPVRLLPLVLVPMLVVAYTGYHCQFEKRRWGLLLWLALAFLVAAPLLLYFVRNPSMFVFRVSQASIVQKGPAAILRSALAVLGMAFVAGDTYNLHNNILGRPAFDAITTVWFLVGLSWSLWRCKRPGYLFLIVWLLVMLLPAILSDNAPLFHRAVGALPPALLIVAIGLEKAVSWGEKRLPRLRGGVVWVGWVSLALSLAITWQAFFGVWAADKALFYARDAGLYAITQVLGREVRAERESSVTYLSPQGWDHPTVQYGLLGLGHGFVLEHMDGRLCVRVPTGQARYIFLAAEDFRGPNLLRTYLPDASIHTAVSDLAGKPYAIELDQPQMGSITFPEMTPDPVQLEDGISLVGYWLSSPELHPGERLYVRLFWRASHTPARQYVAFAHLLMNRPDGTSLQVAGADAPPGKGSCTTDSWLPGETVVDELELLVPTDLIASGACSLEVGFYTLPDGRRLAVPGHRDDTIVIAALPLAGNG